MKNLSRYGLIGVLLVTILLGWYSSSLSDDLKAAKKDNKDLASDVKDWDETIADLKGAADADRRATEQQLKLEQLKREKADVENGKLRRALRIATVAISVCLILLSTSCRLRTPPPPVPTKLIYVYPPAVLLQQCQQTLFTGETFGDAVVALQVSQSELDICASRIEGVIKWQRNNADNTSMVNQ